MSGYVGVAVVDAVDVAERGEAVAEGDAVLSVRVRVDTVSEGSEGVHVGVKVAVRVVVGDRVRAWVCVPVADAEGTDAELVGLACGDRVQVQLGVAVCVSVAVEVGGLAEGEGVCVWVAERVGMSVDEKLALREPLCHAVGVAVGGDRVGVTVTESVKLVLKLECVQRLREWPGLVEGERDSERVGDRDTRTEAEAVRLGVRELQVKPLGVSVPEEDRVPLQVWVMDRVRVHVTVAVMPGTAVRVPVPLTDGEAEAECVRLVLPCGVQLLVQEKAQVAVAEALALGEPVRVRGGVPLGVGEGLGGEGVGVGEYEGVHDPV